MQITDNAVSDMWPVVSGDRIAWAGYVGGGGAPVEVMTWTPTSGTSRITSDTVNDTHIEISGDRIAWDNGGYGADVYTWTPSSGIQRLTNTPTWAETYPVVSGDRIVWQGQDADGDNEVYTWTPAAGITQVSRNTLPDQYPTVSGNRIVWTGYGAADVTWEVFTAVPPPPTLTFTIDAIVPPVGGSATASAIEFGVITRGTPKTGTQRLTVEYECCERLSGHRRREPQAHRRVARHH